MQLRGVANQPIAHLDHICMGYGKPDRRAQPGGQELIGQYPDMLGIIAKFDHVQLIVRR